MAAKIERFRARIAKGIQSDVDTQSRLTVAKRLYGQPNSPTAPATPLDSDSATPEDIANRFLEQAERYIGLDAIGAVDSKWQNWAENHEDLINSSRRGISFITYDSSSRRDINLRLVESDRQARAAAEAETRKRAFSFSLAKARELAQNPDPLIQKPGILWHDNPDARRRIAPFLANLNLAVHEIAQKAQEQGFEGHDLDELAMTFGALIDPKTLYSKPGNSGRFLFSPVARRYEPTASYNGQRLLYPFRHINQSSADFTLTIKDLKTPSNIVINLFPTLYSRYGTYRNADGLRPEEARETLRSRSKWGRHDDNGSVEDNIVEALSTYREPSLKVRLERVGKPNITVSGEFGEPDDKPRGLLVEGFRLKSPNIPGSSTFMHVEKRTPGQVHKQTVEIGRATTLQILARDLSGMEIRP